MTGDIGKPERETQRRVIALFRDELKYRFLGDWTDRDGNSNIEEKHLTDFLRDKGGYSPAQISAAIYKLTTEANNSNRGLCGNNHEVYKLLRYGVDVKTEAGKATDKIWLINWERPEENEFAIAEEVTLKGEHQRRPDLVLYVNGIAIGVLELKRSSIGIGEGIRQNLSNQLPEFNEWFFSTIQIVFAGNDTEGLRYGTIKTEEKYFLTWKEDEADDTRYKLDKYLLKMCEKKRLIELMHDFVLFDGGVKKLPRVHQYFGIKAAQEYVRKKKGGMIWHTQGSGKSIVMVLLAKWILENNPNARVAIITDRDELDKQIVRVLRDAGMVSKDDEDHKVRATSGRDLISKLIEAAEPRKISPFDNIGLIDLIVKSGIADAIASRLGGLKGNQDAIAETIENNVRSKIIKEKMSDPAFYEKMSALLDEVIALRKAKAIAYEEYLNRMANVIKTLEAGKTDDTPAKLDSPGKRAIYNVLKKSLEAGGAVEKVAETQTPYAPDGDSILDLTMKIDETVKHVRPDGWRGVQSKEEVIKAALYAIVQDIHRVENLFTVIFAQKEY